MRVTLLIAVICLVAVALAIREIDRKEADSSPRVAAATRPPAPEWTGSEVCGECHKSIYDRWKLSTHARATRPFAQEHSARPFDGEIFVTRDIEMRLGPGATMECDGPGGEMGRYEVDWVLGARRIQMFTTRADNGEIQVLPVFIEVPEKRWFDYAEFIYGGPNVFEIAPDSPNTWYGPLRNFNRRCGACHVSNFVTNYDPDQGTFASTWSELVIGCEACHGAGGSHVDKWRNLTDDPEPLIDLATLSVSRANQNCGFCHSESVVIAPGFKPGDDLFRFNEVSALEDAVRSKPDGRANGLFHNLILVMEAKCGELSCMECHDPHGGGIPGDLYRELEWDGLCTKCHGDLMSDIEAHTFHRGDSPGSRCVNCHLAPVVIESGRGQVRDHTISTPSPQNTRKYGLPNACVECHLAEAPGWVEEWFERWWPGAEERNHRTKLCDTLFAARSDREDATEGLISLAHGANPVYRAAAVWELGGSDVDLRPWLRDAHALVQRGAIDGVAKSHPEALEPLLGHPNPVLRGAAAEALAAKRVKSPFDWMRDRPALRERVLVVLEEMARLRSDRSSPHYLAAVLHELSGRREAARSAYERYLRLNPYDDRVRSHLKTLQ